jgi:pyruvate/2-oxoglutarate dehydrogenase complex dihydrolipoamide acyltransferase (E2) component
MTTPVVIPRLGMTMTEATLLEWVVADGATVRAGEVLFRLETDKVETDCEAVVSGVVRHQAEPGAVYDVGTVIAEIEDASG